MSFTIPKELVSRLTKKFDYEQARAAVATLTNNGQCEEEVKAAYEALLASHPGKNGNASHAEKDEGEAPAQGNQPKVGRVWEEKLGGSGLTQAQVLEKLSKQEIDVGEAQKLMAQGDGLTIFCSAKSGWICIGGKGRFPSNLHPELAERICNDEILAILAKHKDETDAALAAAKAAK